MTRRSILFTACSLGALAAPAAAGAQSAAPSPAPVAPSPSPTDPTATATEQDTGQIADIVVTAQRREESLQRVPVAVTALNQQMLEARGITSLTNLSTNVTPGLVVTPFAGAPTTLSFNIRGATGSDPGTGLTEQGVAVYVDGVPIGRATGSGIELGDVERIEVLRGPQGTLFGRNAEGGAVQYVTSRPSDELHARAEVQYGNYDAVRALGQINIPLGDTFAIKIAGLIDRHDGYVKKAPIGPADTIDPDDVHDFADYNNKGFRVAARWRPSSAFEAYYSYDFTNTRFTDFFTVRTGSRTPSEPAFCQVPMFGLYCASPQTLAANIYTGTQQPQDPGIKRAPYPLYNPYNKDRVRGHTLILSYEASDQITLKSITGVRSLKERLTTTLGAALPFVQFVPSSLFNGNPLDGEVPAGTTIGASGSISQSFVDQNQFSEELQFLGKFDRFELTSGLFYFHEKVTDIRNSFFDLAYVDVGGGNVGVFSTAPFSLQPSRVGYRASADSYAAYAQGTFTPALLDEGLKLTAGIRYTNDTKRFLRNISDYNPAQLDSRSRFKNGRFDPAFVIAYQAGPSLNLYGKYSSAYRAGGTQIRNKIALTTYAPEINKTFEIGAKTELLDRHVRLNVAAFRSRIHGKQFTQQNLTTDPSSTDTLNLPSTLTVKGVETELTISPVRGVTFGANYAYLDVKQPSVVNGVPFGLSGAPKNSISLTGDFAYPVGSMEIALHIDYNYLSKYISSSAYLPPISVAPTKLSVTNARFDLRKIPIAGTSADVFVFGRNLFNVHNFSYTYAAGTSDFTLNPIGGAGNVIAPRTYGIGLRVDL